MPRLKEFVLGYNHQEAPNLTPLFGKKRSLYHILQSPLKQHIPSHEQRSEVRVRATHQSEVKGFNSFKPLTPLTNQLRASESPFGAHTFKPSQKYPPMTRPFHSKKVLDFSSLPDSKPSLSGSSRRSPS